MNKRRTLLAASLGLVAVAAAATVTDIVVEHKVEHRVAGTAACRLDTHETVSVGLDSRLAGLRALTGTVGTVRINASGVRRQGTELDVAASLHDVSTDGRTSGGTATATVAYGQLAERLPAGADGLTPGTDGKHLVLTGTVGSLGLPVTVTTTLTTTAHAVTVAPSTVSVLGQTLSVDDLSSLPAAAGLAGRLGPRTVDIGTLPAGARLTGAHATADGLALDFRLAPAAAGRTGGAAASCAL
ncbi:LmeA family phospholipid-binding protein [Streptomyces sp. NPDC008150]|uniref:LmeA family phospholipid-binding protein n=1 Tax=Streptomyces sp. NPDC008150 TaxID=3364816 RepID=UPI0036EF6FBF